MQTTKMTVVVLSGPSVAGMRRRRRAIALRRDARRAGMSAVALTLQRALKQAELQNREGTGRRDELIAAYH